MAIAFLKNENTAWKILSTIDNQINRFKSFDVGLVKCDLKAMQSLVAQYLRVS